MSKLGDILFKETSMTTAEEKWEKNFEKSMEISRLKFINRNVSAHPWLIKRFIFLLFLYHKGSS